VVVRIDDDRSDGLAGLVVNLIALEVVGDFRLGGKRQKLGVTSADLRVRHANTVAAGQADGRQRAATNVLIRIKKLLYAAKDH